MFVVKACYEYIILIIFAANVRGIGLSGSIVEYWSSKPKVEGLSPPGVKEQYCLKFS